MFQSYINHFLLALCIITLSACGSMPEKKPVVVDSKKVIKAPANYNSAVSAAKKGKTRAAINLLTKITQKHPDFSPAFTNLGLQYLKSKKSKKAENALKKALSLNSKDATAYNHLGIIMRMKGEFSGAKNMYKQAIKSNENYANAHLNLGILLDMYMHELPDALQHYKSYQSLTKNSDKLVGKWIIDIERRIKSGKKKES